MQKIKVLAIRLLLEEGFIILKVGPALTFGFREGAFALNKMLDNLSNMEIPLTLISQYKHLQYLKIRQGKLKPNAYELLKDRIGEYIDDYIYAISK